MPETVEPDEFGRVRVTDKDTGHRLSISASAVPHGNYTVLKQPASDAAGEALAPEYGAVKPLSNNSGQQADTEKEKSNG